MDTTTIDLEGEARQALVHLYDPAFLRKSRILGALGLQGKPGAAEALRTALEAAIERLKPSPDCPTSARGRLYHQVLFYRYVQQFGQVDVARQLGVSARHLRRLQVEAIEALLDQLCAHIRTPEASETGGLPPSALGQELAPPSSSPQATMQGEMLWLGDSLSDQVTQIGPLLHEALALVANLAAKYGVSLDARVPESLPLAVAPPSLLKQMVLSLMGAAIPSVPRGRVRGAAATEPGQVVLAIEASAPGPGDAPPWDPACLEVTRELAGLCGAELQLLARGRLLTALIRLASTEQVTVLAIEDNADTLHLWARYVEDSRYHLLAVQEPGRALDMAIQLAPAVIILDLMMPGVDGWTLLGRLRNHPSTTATRVVVCTVLPQRELALSLGAADFMRKPVTRREFLEVLARQIEAAASQ